MKLNIQIFFAVLIGISAGFLLWRQMKDDSISVRPRVSESSYSVVTSISPLAMIVDEVGGGHVEVSSIIPPGADHHFYEPAPSEALAIQQAEKVFVIGVEFDQWVEDIVDSPDKIIDLSSEVRLLSYGEEDKHEEVGHDEDGYIEDDHGHEHGEYDPHYWLNPINAQKMAKKVRDELVEIDPENENDYTSHYYTFTADIDELLFEYDDTFKAMKDQKIITTHDAYSYLANILGAEVIASFEPVGGGETSPQFIAEVEEALTENDIDVIFSDPHTDSETVTQIAQDYGVTVIPLDAIGGVEGRESYLDLVRYNLEQISKTVESEGSDQNSNE